MDPAHTRDPRELPRALEHVHALHRKATEQVPGGDSRQVLRSGAAAVIFGNGVVQSVGAPEDGSGKVRRGVRTTVPEDPGPGEAGLLSALASRVHLAYGFRSLRLVPLDDHEVALLLAATRHNILPFMVDQKQVGTYSETFGVDGGTLDDPDPRRFVEGVMSGVWPLEDSCCMSQLERLPWHDRSPDSCRSAEDVARFVLRLNAAENHTALLDTVFVSLPFMDSMEREPGRHEYENVMRATGALIVSSDGVPDGTMYVTSSWHGPLFVNGPTVVHSDDDGLVVARYCAAHESAYCSSSPGRGFAVRV